MKKTLLAILCTIVLLTGCIALSAMAADTPRTAYCQACKETVTWEPVDFGKLEQAVGDAAVHLHYYLPTSYKSTASADQLNMKGKITLCLDLNGNTWESYGRAFIAGSSDNGCSTINLMDTAGGGKVSAFSKKTSADTGTNNVAGGVMCALDGCYLNIYSGTYELNAVETEYGLRTDNGGVVYVSGGGTLNLYGGTICGGKVTKNGGAVYVAGTGKMNAYGGMITSGTSTNNLGGCVSIQNDKGAVTLRGDAQVENIFVNTLNASQLVIDGSYTGKTNLTYKSTVTLEVGTVVGSIKNSGSIEKAELYCTNGYSILADGTSLKLAEPSLEETREECPHCKQSVKWEVFSTAVPFTGGTYHYYLDKDYSTAEAKQRGVKEGAQVCLDLRGHSYETVGRAFNTEGSGSTLNLMDTVGTGKVAAYGGNNNPGGGVITQGANTAFNLYGGTLEFYHTPENSPKYGGTGRGGVIQSSGTTNIYGGKIVGGEVVDCTYEFTGIEGAGGAIYLTGTLNLYGGEILSGTVPASGAGPCVYVASASAKVMLSGDSKVEELCLSSYTPAQLSVSGTYTGSAKIVYNPAITMTERMPIGTVAANAKMGEADITCGDYFVLPSGQSLVLSSYSADAAAVTGGKEYASLQAAIDACTDGYVELMKDTSEAITVSKDLCLQLNGCSVTGKLTIAQGATLYGKDSATDDYSVADGKYGKLSNVEGNVAGSDGYLLVQEADGFSFHCVTLQIYAMTLRLDKNQEPGLFYKSHFKTDEKAAPKIATYGVALSVVGEPNAQNMGTIGSYTELTGFESGTLGNMGNASSTLLTGILKSRNTEAINLRNLQKQIYGRAYAKTVDGQVLMGPTVCRSLAQQLQGVDELIPTLSESQLNVVITMHDKFKTILKTLELPGIAQAVQTNEEGILKVLVLGNSHSLDATNLLYEVFQNEAPEQKLVLGALYYSGCTMKQHDKFLTANSKVYAYCKNDGTNPNRTWTRVDATCLDALQDEQWDVIFMQSSCTWGSDPEGFGNEWKVVADYLLNNQDIAPKLALHFGWSTPEDYELFLNDDAPYKHPYNATSIRENLEKTYGINGKFNQRYQYDLNVSAVKRILIDSTDVVGRAFDMAVSSATVVQYAKDVCGRPLTELYRDYAHLNDYSRLMVSYAWYATLMGIDEITEVKMDTIPVALKHKNSKFPVADADGIYHVTQDMKEDLIESVNWALKNPWSLPEQ